MWDRINLRTRIYVILTSLIVITLGGGLVMVWYTHQIQAVILTITEKNVAAFQAAEELEIALVNQKGFVSYYFLDGDPAWLKRLKEYRERFTVSLEAAKKGVESGQDKAELRTIQEEYDRYVRTKDKVIDHYSVGAREQGTALHQEVRQHFFRILDLTKGFKDRQLHKIREARQKSHDQAARLRLIAWSAVFAVLLLGLLLAFVLTTQILGPVRRLALKADREGSPVNPVDEVEALSRGVDDLIENIDQSQSELEKSQEVLLHAEKLTLVGKLAAGTAHSIRNPLTSVKMRLFSLARGLEFSPDQQEDLKVISQELNHIDTIVENFLGFSRPPKLKKRQISPSHIIDLCVKLLRQRLDSCHVGVRVEKWEDPLPLIEADPELFKEALLNIILNACEAMTGGGFIVITESVEAENGGENIVIRIADNGPGVPKAIQDDIFQPFFTTKEDGTGLGLSIAVQIIKQHGGAIHLVSEENNGAAFIISLPFKEKGLEQDIDHR